MSIDRGDSHFEDAGTWNKACRHIALYLWWAVERGLGGEEHVDLAPIRKAPTKYFIGACDCKLWDVDFNAEGVAFAEAMYSPYCVEVERYAKKLGIDDYAVKENAATAAHFFAFLDNKLATWRTKAPSPAKAKAKPAKAKAKPKAKPKAKKKPAKPSRDRRR